MQGWFLWIQRPIHPHLELCKKPSWSRENPPKQKNRFYVNLLYLQEMPSCIEGQFLKFSLFS